MNTSWTGSFRTTLLYVFVSYKLAECGIGNLTGHNSPNASFSCQMKFFMVAVAPKISNAQPQKYVSIACIRTLLLSHVGL